jgi:hypothetical protein
LVEDPHEPIRHALRIELLRVEKCRAIDVI